LEEGAITRFYFLVFAVKWSVSLSASLVEPDTWSCHLIL